MLPPRSLRQPSRAPVAGARRTSRASIARATAAPCRCSSTRRFHATQRAKSRTSVTPDAVFVLFRFALSTLELLIFSAYCFIFGSRTLYLYSTKTHHTFCCCEELAFVVLSWPAVKASCFVVPYCLRRTLFSHHCLFFFL